MPPSWVFDELAHAGAEHLDARYVAGYNRKAQVDPTDDLARLSALGLDRTSTVVDLGAGTGSFALAVAPLCHRVVAVDVSTPMLKLLYGRSSERGLKNIEPVQAGFLTYQHQGSPADFVYSRNALHHLPDFWKTIALQRMATMLHGEGVLLLRDLVYSFAPEDAEGIIASWLERAPVRAEEGYTAADLTAHVRTEFSTYSWLLEPMLKQAGFEIREAKYPFQVFAAYTCVKR
jgi:ubiquinone/menaquinone biosynthesis C-methylase UbiE